MAVVSPPLILQSALRGLLSSYSQHFTLDTCIHASLLNVRFLQPEFKNSRSYFPPANYLTILLDVTQCSQVEVPRSVGGPYRLHILDRRVSGARN